MAYYWVTYPDALRPEGKVHMSKCKESGKGDGYWITAYREIPNSLPDPAPCKVCNPEKQGWPVPRIYLGESYG